MRREPIRHPATASSSVPTDGTIMTVAHPMGFGSSPLGLDRPLALLGSGTNVEPGGMPQALGIDHVPGIRRFVAEACRHQALAGQNWYRQPPLALLGWPGAGKGMVARWIARHAGLPLFRMPVDGTRHEADAGVHAMPPLPVVAMAASRCANPVIVVEMNMGSPPSPAAEAELVEMIDPRRNGRWIHDAMDVILDLSQISWIIEVQGHEAPPRDRHFDEDVVHSMGPALPASLARVLDDAGTVLEVDLRQDREELRRLDVAIEACASEGLDDAATVAAVWSDLLTLPLQRGHHSSCDALFHRARRAIAVSVRGHAT